MANPEIHLVIQINGCLISQCYGIDPPPYFKNNQLTLAVNNKEFMIHPGTKELMKYLDKNRYKLTFFSNRSEEETGQLTKALLVSIFGNKRYSEMQKNISFCSKNKVTEIFKHNLNWSLLIDDQFGLINKQKSRIGGGRDYGIERNLLVTGVEDYQLKHICDKNFSECELERFSTRDFYDVNHVFFIVGVLDQAITAAVKNKTTLADEIFSIQFMKLKDGKCEYLRETKGMTYFKEYYQSGLCILQQINKSITFLVPNDYMSSIKNDFPNSAIRLFQSVNTQSKKLRKNTESGCSFILK